VVAAQAVTLLGSLGPRLAEAGAILKVIQLCVSLGLQRVIFEGDSKGVVDGIHSTAENWSHKGMMLEYSCSMSLTGGWSLFVEKEIKLLILWPKWPLKIV
jgi:ribonuclease HI